jgi:ABC-type proline/glycine betaine transport system substrate-binding protein
MKNLKTLLLLVAVLTLFAACKTEKKKIIMGEGDWDSSAFHNQVAKFIIENGYDTEVELVLSDSPVQISSLKTKDMDVILEMWSDNEPNYDKDIKAGEYLELGTNFDDNMQGLYVPKYLVEGPDALAPDLKTVKDLKKYAHLFPNPEGGGKGIIYGGPEGWNATKFMHNKVKTYGLDEMYDFRPIDSNAALSATLSGAYQKKEPWVGYNWEPTWIMGLYDMVLLEDSPYNADDFAKGIGSFASVNVTICVNNDFPKNYPEINKFLSNYKTSSELTSKGLAYMQEKGVEADAAAKWFIGEHKDLVKKMVSSDAYEKVIKALNK